MIIINQQNSLSMEICFCNANSFYIIFPFIYNEKIFNLIWQFIVTY